MRRFARIAHLGPGRHRALLSVATGVVLLGAALASGVAAAPPAKDRVMDVLLTREVVQPFNAEPYQLSWPAVGQVALKTEFSGGDGGGSEAFPYSAGGIGLGIQNNGTGTIWVAASSDGGSLRIPGGAGDVLMAGQWLNEFNPDGGSFQVSFAILDEGGMSASGSISWSIELDLVTRTVHAVFTYQLRGMDPA